MLLNGKVAVIYGGAGAVGGATARAFAREGAKVYLVGRTLGSVEAMAEEIGRAGGIATAATVDATDRTSVESLLDDILDRWGRIDISYNLVGADDFQGTPFVDLPLEHYLAPIDFAMRSHFITATAAARRMAHSSGGVVLALTANAGKQPGINQGGFGVSCAAIEAFFRQFALEVGPSGIRTVVLRSAGSPDTPGVAEAMRIHAAEQGMTLDEALVKWAEGIPLRRFPMLNDVADAAVIAASDYARTMTGAIWNVTCGGLFD